MEFVSAVWNAPANIKALTTTRSGGVSLAPYSSLNLGMHTKDNPSHVAKNRQILLSALGLKRSPLWLNQVHGTRVIKANEQATDSSCDADACWTDEAGLACVIMTADCLPVFFCDSQGQRVALAHAGWRGLCNGVLENTLRVFDNPADVSIWLGPAIGATAFEVGEDVVTAFTKQQANAITAFNPLEKKTDKYLANLYQLATMRLQAAGVRQIFCDNRCTFSEPDLFYSYRRDGTKTGRMASMIWLSATN